MRRALPLLLAGLTISFAGSAAADDDPVAAARALDKSKKPKDAAAAWEAAYEKTKTPKHLYLAAKDRMKSSDPVHAANDYARYLAAAPPTGETKEKATAKKELANLEKKLGRFAIRATGSTKITVDGEPIDMARAETIYVMAGAHKIEATYDTGVGKEDATAVVGQSVAVVVSAPVEGEQQPAVPTPATAENSTAAAPQNTASSSKKFSLPPLAAYIGGGITVVLGGLTILSAIDTQSQKATFDKDKTQANLDEGKSKQTRTNILLVSTAVFAVGTAVVALVLVDWKRTDMKLGLGPTSFLLEKSF